MDWTSIYLEVGGPVPSVHVVAEHLVVVRVDQDALKVGLRHVPVERVERLETVRDDQGQSRLARGSLGSPRVSSRPVGVVPVLPGRLEELVVDVCGGLVEQAQRSNDLPVRWVRVLFRERLDDVLGPVDIVAVGGPVWLSAVVPSLSH